jgi:hypothetical protein
VTGPTRTPHRMLVVGIVVVLGVGCTEPELQEVTPPAEDAEDVLAAQAPDPVRDELLVSLDTLAATVAAAQAELDAAASSEDAATARRSAAAALALLLDDPDTRASTTPALFPARTTEREEAAAVDDLLNVTLTAAREAGGSLGRATVAVLREPVAGDLGAWERDAEGVIASASTVVRDARDVEAVAEDVLALPADGLRALAWTLLATETRDAAVTRAAAERGSAHLGVVLIGLGLLDDTTSASDPSDAGADPGDSETDQGDDPGDGGPEDDA